MTNLIIVESPTKAKTLTKFLGKGYTVDATMGHIMDLPKSKLSVDIEHNFEPMYVPMDKKKDTIARIQKEAAKATQIYIATDPDREGEAIASHVAEILKTAKVKVPKSKLKRIVFHEITKTAVEHAIAEPREVDAHLVDAQIARRVLDRLVGYKLSPLLWKKVRRGLSAGRVQSVAVRLIVEREREIQKFKPEEYWEI
jgi:DNA topoisomerase-1